MKLVSQKMVIWKGFEFLTFGWVFVGVKNNSKNFGNKKNIGLFFQNFEKMIIICQKNTGNSVIL